MALTATLYGGAAADWAGLEDWMQADRRLVFEKGEVWRLLTTMLSHSDLGHLLANTPMFVVLGYLLTGYFGPRLYPLLAWGLAIPMTAIALLTYPPETDLIGASGLVHLMGGMWLSLYFFLSRNLRMSQRCLRALGVLLALFFPSSFEQNVSYRAHFIGLGVGLIAGAAWFHAHKDKLLMFEEVHIETDDGDELETEEATEGEDEIPGDPGLDDDPNANPDVRKRRRLGPGRG